ncbi:MAG: hypothetical protein GY820_44330 [Gammaproteobacteria bacterium]|nr:hypothetical protein [Gammaproteobacteria bacterium]
MLRTSSVWKTVLIIHIVGLRTVTPISRAELKRAVNVPMQVTADALHYSMQPSKSVPFMQPYQQIATLSRCVINSPCGSMAWNRKIF